MTIERRPSLSVVLEIEGIPYTLTPGQQPRSFSLRKQVVGAMPYTLVFVPGGVVCNCPDSQKRGARCKHAYALLRLLKVLVAVLDNQPLPSPEEVFNSLVPA